MTTLTDTQVITASGGLVELGYGSISSAVTVTNATAGTGQEIIAPVTVVCDGSPILIEFYSPAVRPNNTVTDELNVSLFTDGVERIRQWGRFYSASTNFLLQPCYLQYRYTPTAGVHTISVRAYVTNAARSGSIGAEDNLSTGYPRAFLRVSKIVQATQWPAVTTGTIICTSSTRPSAPFEGQTIYETDTKRSWTRVGTQWVPDDMVFTNEAARDAAITSPTEGMRAYLTASTVAAATGATYSTPPTGITTIYNGSVWVCTTSVGAYSHTAGTTTSTSFTTTLTGDSTAVSVTSTTGTTALVSISAQCQSNATSGTQFSFSVSGATTIAAAEINGTMVNFPAANYWMSIGRTYIFTGLTAGSNTFTLNYKVGANTATYQNRSLTVAGIA